MFCFAQEDSEFKDPSAQVASLRMTGVCSGQELSRRCPMFCSAQDDRSLKIRVLMLLRSE